MKNKQNIILGELDKLIVHYVGNKTNGDGVKFSNALTLSDDIKACIKRLVTSNFNMDEFYSFYFIPELELNPVFKFISSIFKDNNTFVDQSQNSARLLYDKSVHPQVKSGELYFSYFRGCEFNNKIVDAVCLFKSENKDTFLKVYPLGDNFEIESHQGANINKLDKGALIFNTGRENGYVVAVVDNTNKGAEAHYWIDEFLHVRQRQDEYYNTQNAINLAKSFIKELPKEFEVSRADQADLVNKTAKFFKEKDSFNMDEFANEVIEQPEVIESFNRYKDNYAQERDIEIADSFAISDSAMKKGARSLKSVIKLDKNFHIYIHGDRNKIENGEDEKGKYYKVYYNEEM